MKRPRATISKLAKRAKPRPPNQRLQQLIADATRKGMPALGREADRELDASNAALAKLRE